LRMILMRSRFIKVHRRSGLCAPVRLCPLTQPWDELQSWVGTQSTVVQRGSAAFVHGLKMHASQACDGEHCCVYRARGPCRPRRAREDPRPTHDGRGGVALPGRQIPVSCWTQILTQANPTCSPSRIACARPCSSWRIPSRARDDDVVASSARAHQADWRGRSSMGRWSPPSLPSSSRSQYC
jgi:hypothetical protein